jgi:hypothetical protein
MKSMLKILVYASTRSPRLVLFTYEYMTQYPNQAQFYSTFVISKKYKYAYEIIMLSVYPTYRLLTA